VQKRVSVQLTFAASVGGRTERAAFMSAKELVFFAPFFWSGKRKGNKKKNIYNSHTSVCNSGILCNFAS